MTKSEKEKFIKSVSLLATGSTVRIRFIHFRDGKEHVFCSTINRLSGNRLSWFDNEAPVIDSEKGDWAKSVIRDLYKKSKGILSHESTGGFPPPKKGV